MNGKQHFKYFLLLFLMLIVPFIYLGIWKYIPLLFLSFSLIDPDEDLKYGHLIHRHFIYHSILWLVIISASLFPMYGWEVLDFLFVCSWALLLHLILDIPSKNRKGTYNIKVFKSRLTSRQTVIFLIVNILIIIAYQGWWIYGVVG